ncbi:MAG TPA: hypothetical protein VJG90_08465 [Candidatus Nanoarchaeia archaeon]|nr:hypothetical protein [Candidatus Nanoarchaeia archaeon]
MRTVVITKKRGKSVGFIIPEFVVNKLNIHAGDAITLTINKKGKKAK